MRRRVRGEAEKLNLYVPHAIFTEAAERYRRAGQRLADKPMTALAFDDSLVAGTVRALFEAMQHGASDLYAETAVHWLATHLLAAHRGWSERGTEAAVVGRLDRVLELMAVRFAEPLSLDELAREAGISKFHFARLFRARTGRSPHAYLLDLRMDAAHRLLTATDLQIADVARRCGYNSSPHFTAAYSRHFKTSPSADRMRRRSSVTPQLRSLDARPTETVP